MALFGPVSHVQSHSTCLQNSKYCTFSRKSFSLISLKAENTKTPFWTRTLHVLSQTVWRVPSKANMEVTCTFQHFLFLKLKQQ